MGTTCQVYVLQNRVGKFYIGVSADSANRLVQHNAGVSKRSDEKTAEIQ
jgi:predicted GIY-YIG superfamily endonuclease